MMRKNLRLVCLLGSIVLVLSMLLPCALAISPVALAADEVEITILHTNDVHARVGAVEPWVSALKTKYEADGKNVVLLSAGDAFHGQPIATVPKGASIVDIMNAAGYDAMAPGNHDFNYGYERLLELEGMMEFALLGANVRYSGTNIFNTDSIIMEFPDVTVGIFGLATPETATKTNPANVKGLTFDDPVAVAKETVAKLRDKEGCDVIIALTHLGLDGSTAAAERSTAIAAVDGIDLVVDGHSHTELPEGKTDAGAPIVQAANYGTRIGEVTIKVDADKKVTVENIKLHVPTGGKYAWEPDKAVEDIITAINEENKPMLSAVVGHTDYTLWGGTPYTRNAETNLANLITDAMLAETGADVAFTNGGGIRDVIQPGNITMGDILTVLPFGNYIVTRQVSGANIRKALEHGIKDYPERAGSYPQIAGIKAVFDPAKPAGSRLVSVTMANGSPMDDNKIYTLATNDFMAVGGDGYTMLATGAEMIYSSLDEAVIDYLATKPAIKAEPEGRLSTLVPAEKKGWLQEDGKWRFYKDGEAVSGWLNDGGKWYCLGSDGTMNVGWYKEGSKWYYLKSSGAMSTGWQKIGSKWYSFANSGAMRTGWYKDNNKWYYMGSNGAMQTGWYKVGNAWYYLGSSGAMSTGWQKVGDKWYYLEASGAMHTGWLNIGNAWYYLKADGSMAASERLTIGGKQYRFNASGRWLG